MNPNTLFDYLDGKLNDSERAELERGLTSDPKMQRELSIAREIHKGMRGSREVFAESEPTARGGVLGRRIAAACVILVFVNVAIGIVFIVGKESRKTQPPPTREAAIRQQLVDSLQKTAETELPAPRIANEITLNAPSNKRDEIAAKVIAAARQFGGSAAKALPDEKSLVVIADLPANRERDFREALAPLGAERLADNSPAAETAHVLIQVHIVEPAK